MLLSERDCHKCKSLDIKPAISNAKTPTFGDFLDDDVGLALTVVEVRTTSNLLETAFLTLMSQVSRAILERIGMNWVWFNFWNSCEEGN